jgi:2-C-methyl-D-erythritol 2,4-cyclodiphosphate synthase
MSSVTQFRIGQGYDVHRLVENRPLWIAGVLIESSTLGAEAHSDGDVVLHALIDALLGAHALGDIGVHFPDTDPRFKNANSSELLQELLSRILPGYQTSWYVENMDITVFLETPKLLPYKATMQQQLATLLALDVNQISLKAKTAEKLGAIGSSMALAASVTLLVSRKCLF